MARVQDEDLLMIRALTSRTAFVFGLLIGPSLSAAAACEGVGCRATAKPLNIMQFMREQAASTRATEPRQRGARAAAKAQRVPHRATAARRKPTRVPPEAAASFALRPAPDVQDVAIDEGKTIDRITDTAAAQSMGATTAPDPEVQLVDAEEFNDIDRKAESARLASVMTPEDNGPTHSEQANVSWLHLIWSAVRNTIAALATAVQQLVRV
jgi:hypothetical protein